MVQNNRLHLWMFFKFVSTFFHLVGTLFHLVETFFSVVKEKKRRRNFFPFLLGVFYNFTTYNDFLSLNQWRRPKIKLKSCRNRSKNQFINIKNYLSLENLKKVILNITPPEFQCILLLTFVIHKHVTRVIWLGFDMILACLLYLSGLDSNKLLIPVLLQYINSGKKQNKHGKENIQVWLSDNYLYLWNCIKLISKASAKHLVDILNAKQENFAGCLFLQAIIRILLVKKIFYCMVVPEENTSPKNDRSDQKDDSHNSQSSSDSGPEPEPEHEFISVEKTYKEGAIKEGQTHIVDTLLIHPYVFTKGATKKNVTYFMCQGCRKYKKYVLATATKENDEWKLLTAPKDHICWSSSEDMLKKEFSRKMYTGISNNPRKPIPKMFNEVTEEMTKGMSIVQKRRFKQVVSQYKGIQSGLYKHRNEKIPTQPKTMVSIRHLSFNFSQLFLCDN